jgi:membrane fusion protein (multidrug efflux system)
MPASPVPVESGAPPTKPEVPGKEQSVAAGPSSRWKRYVTPVLVVLLALAVFVTLVRNWNSWEVGKAEQVTDDAYVRGDLTPLSTKVTGIVSGVHVADYQQVKKGDLLPELQDSDYQAEVAQANAGVAAAKAAIENNRRQKQLQQAKIDRALAGVSQAPNGPCLATSMRDASEVADHVIRSTGVGDRVSCRSVETPCLVQGGGRGRGGC